EHCDGLAQLARSLPPSLAANDPGTTAIIATLTKGADELRASLGTVAKRLEEAPQMNPVLKYLQTRLQETLTSLEAKERLTDERRGVVTRAPSPRQAGARFFRQFAMAFSGTPLRLTPAGLVSFAACVAGLLMLVVGIVLLVA